MPDGSKTGYDRPPDCLGAGPGQQQPADQLVAAACAWAKPGQHHLFAIPLRKSHPPAPMQLAKRLHPGRQPAPEPLALGGWKNRVSSSGLWQGQDLAPAPAALVCAGRFGDHHVRTVCFRVTISLRRQRPLAGPRAGTILSRRWRATVISTGFRAPTASTSCLLPRLARRHCRKPAQSETSLRYQDGGSQLS